MSEVFPQLTIPLPKKSSQTRIPRIATRIRPRNPHVTVVPMCLQRLAWAADGVDCANGADGDDGKPMSRTSGISYSDSPVTNKNQQPSQRGVYIPKNMRMRPNARVRTSQTINWKVIWGRPRIHRQTKASELATLPSEHSNKIQS